MSHWYAKASNGKTVLHDITKTEAKRAKDKYTLFAPSVTTVISEVFGTPYGLVQWMLNEHIEVCWSKAIGARRYDELPGCIDYVKNVCKSRLEQSSKEGTEVHNVLEKSPELVIPLVEKQYNCAVLEVFCEEKFVRLGYGGTIDLVLKVRYDDNTAGLIVLDYKTKDASKDMSRVQVTDAHRYQLAAYCDAMSDMGFNVSGAIMFVPRLIPFAEHRMDQALERAVIKPIPDDKLRTATKVWYNALDIWHLNNPSFTIEE